MAVQTVLTVFGNDCLLMVIVPLLKLYHIDVKQMIADKKSMQILAILNLSIQKVLYYSIQQFTN